MLTVLFEELKNKLFVWVNVRVTENKAHLRQVVFMRCEELEDRNSRAQGDFLGLPEEIVPRFAETKLRKENSEENP